MAPRKRRRKPREKQQPRTIRAMEPDRFEYLLNRLDLSQRAAGRFLGIHDRTIRNFVNGSSAIDPRTAMLLEIMVKFKIEPEEALKLIGIDVKAAAAATLEEMGPQAAPRYFGELR